MQQFDFDIIGTHLDLRIDTSEDCSIIFSQIETRLHDFEVKYSRFIEENWLADLNKNRTGTLDTDGQKMLEFILNISQKTDGYFDPTVGKRLTELGYGKKSDLVGDMSDQKKSDYRDVELDGDRVTLHADIMLEFGGVGKGYLIDVIKNMLELYPRFLINFGGDMFGRSGWKVGLESPFASDEVIGTIILDDHFLACSAGTRRAWGTHHHLIDPHTGESANAVIASYIEGVSGMISDAYATALCVMPWEKAILTLQKTPEISGVIVSVEGNIYQKEASRADIFG